MARVSVLDRYDCSRLPRHIVERLGVLTNPLLGTEEMARLLGLSVETVRFYRRVLVACGLDRRRGARRVPLYTLLELFSAVRRGVPVRRAAEALGISPATAYRWCRAVGIEPVRGRPPGVGELAERVRRLVSERGVVTYAELRRALGAAGPRLRLAIAMAGAKSVRVVLPRGRGRRRAKRALGRLIGKTLVWIDDGALAELLIREASRGGDPDTIVQWASNNLPPGAAEALRRRLAGYRAARRGGRR